MNVVEFGDIKVEYPSMWEEHTEEQHLFVIQQMLKLYDGKIDVDSFEILVLFHFLGIKYDALAAAKEKRFSFREQEIYYENINRLRDTIRYFFKTEKDENGIEHRVVDYDTIKNFIPRLKVGNNYYYGPDDGFQNLVFIEFLDALNWFKLFQDTKEETYLDKLIAVLYRPEVENYEIIRKRNDFDGNRRVKYNRNLVEWRAEHLGKLPFYYKWAVYLYFNACYHFITSEEIDVNGITVNLGTLFRKENPDNISSGKGLGMTGLMFKIAETGIFGNVESVAYQNIYDILLVMYQQKVEYDEMKRKLKQDDKHK